MGDPPYVRLSAFYLFYFAVLGALVPYWGPYLKHLGFGAAEIGELTAMLMATRIVAPLIVGWVSDRTGKRMLLVQLSCWLAAATFVGVLLGNEYGWLAWVTALFSFFWAAALAPFEAVTLNHLGRDTPRYGLIRLWGSLGFIVSVVVLGWALERHTESLLPPLCLGMFCALAASSVLIPRCPSRPQRQKPPPIGRVLLRAQVVAVLLTSLLMQASHGPYYTFFSIYLEGYGYAKTWIGPLWALGVVAEIGAFLLMPRLLSRFKPRSLLLVALGVATARWLLIAGFAGNLPVLLLAQTFHAASYAVFHAVVIQYIHRDFTGPNQDRGQALYSSICYGLGAAVGSLVAGYAWAAIGPESTYAACALLPAIGLLIAYRWIGRTAE
ncbi:MFS transporter [Planctomycetota bacterium]